MNLFEKLNRLDDSLVESKNTWRDIQDEIAIEWEDSLNPFYDESNAGDYILKLMNTAEKELHVQVIPSVQGGHGDVYIHLGKSYGEVKSPLGPFNFNDFSKEIIDLVLEADTENEFIENYKSDILAYLHTDDSLVESKRVIKKKKLTEGIANSYEIDGKEVTWPEYFEYNMEINDYFMDEQLFSAFYDKAVELVKKEGFTDVSTEPSTQAGRGSDFFWATKDGISYRGSYDYEEEQAIFYNAAVNADSEEEAIDNLSKAYAKLIISNLTVDEEDYDDDIDEMLTESYGYDELTEFMNWIQEYRSGALWDDFVAEFDSEEDPGIDDVLSWLETFDEDAYLDYTATEDEDLDEVLTENRWNPYFTPYGYRDAAKVLNGKAPEYYYHLKELEMDTGDGIKLARYALRKGLPVMVEKDSDPDYPQFAIKGKYHWDDYFYPYPSAHEEDLIPWDGKMFTEQSLTEGSTEQDGLEDEWQLIKSDKTYDPEGLDIVPPDVVLCSGTEEKCREEFNKLVVRFRMKEKTENPPQLAKVYKYFIKIEKLTPDTLVVYYPQAQSKDIYRLRKVN